MGKQNEVSLDDTNKQTNMIKNECDCLFESFESKTVIQFSY